MKEDLKNDILYNKQDNDKDNRCTTKRTKSFLLPTIRDTLDLGKWGFSETVTVLVTVVIF